MHRDEVTTPWRESGRSSRGATRSAKVASRDFTSPGDGALSFSLDEWQAFVAKVQAMAPYSLGAWAEALRGGSLLCHHRMITAAKSPTWAAAANGVALSATDA